MQPTINKIIFITYQNDENSKQILNNNWFFGSNKALNLSSYVCDKQGPQNNHSSILFSYCSKVPIPINGWMRAQNYNESDVGFLIITSSTFYHTRAIAVRDTWLSRITYKYFLSEKPYSWLPVTVIKEAGEDKLSNMKKIFYGLQIVYKQQQNSSYPHKWYYIASCDTFVNVHHILKRLDAYDYTKPFFIGGHSSMTTCPDSKSKTLTIEYPGDGNGFFLSSKLVELIMPHLTNYVENIWPRNMSQCNECSGVALTCLIYKLGIQLTKMPGFWTNNPDRTLYLDGRKAFHKDPEPNTYHKVSHNEMYDLDEFYALQYVDRLVNDKNRKELTEYIRRFISSHYDLLSMKRSECTLPKIGNQTSVS
ncbi:unnamed protein product [Rotaria sordida]|uniref:N-acetylgalactosaminide beta-1,3-galactosyltransferase n=1 Tax=Rotaria sordida TaxID=392033 RepID=A0A818PAC1_9BILA|nr:unnamed protein product [Rotaria sordida]CAF3686291.1 unnamed protein product [Rotaria sordida]